MRITEAAVGEGFAVVALSSQDRTHNRCWDTGWPPQHTADIPKVANTYSSFCTVSLYCIIADLCTALCLNQHYISNSIHLHMLSLRSMLHLECTVHFHCNGCCFQDYQQYDNGQSCTQVTWAFQALVKQQGWSELPLYALGASSGGALVLLLALRFPFQVPPHVSPV